MRRQRRSFFTSFGRFVLFQTEQQLFRKRWWVLPPILLFIAYTNISGMLIQVSNHSLEANIWDVLFSIFGNGNIIFFVMTLLFLYLVSDMAGESKFGETIMLRLGSRQLWWLGKVVALLLLTIFYLIIMVGLIVAVASFALPWQRTWSSGAFELLFEFQLTPEILSLSPYSAFSQLVLLLLLGWFCLGLLMMIVSQWTSQPILGFAAGVLTNFLSLVAWRNSIPFPYELLFIHQHLLFNSHPFSSNSLLSYSVIVSVIYWIVWIGLFCVLGRQLSRKHDFLGREESR